MDILLGINILFTGILFIIIIVNSFKLRKLKKKYDKFMKKGDNLSLEKVLNNCIDELNDISEKSKEIELLINKLQRQLLSCVQKVGVVRFNAFDNVGSDLSFAVALLDSNDSGVVISGLYSRESSSTYSKPIMNGKSKYALSAEEIKAINLAQKSAYSV